MSKLPALMDVVVLFTAPTALGGENHTVLFIVAERRSFYKP